MAIKLNPAVAAEIRRRAKEGETPKALAGRHGVSQAQIRNILSGGAWQTAEEAPAAERATVTWEDVAYWIERAGLATTTGETTR